MNRRNAQELLNLAVRAEQPVWITGASGIGKTAFCLDRFPKAKIIQRFETGPDHLHLLRALLPQTQTLIFENLTEAEMPFLLPILKTGTLLGEPLHHTILLTAVSRPSKEDGFLEVSLEKPTFAEWKALAKPLELHPLLVQVTGELELLETATPRTLVHLSKLLQSGIPIALLEPVVAQLLPNRPELVNALREGLSREVPFEEVIGLEQDAFIDTLKHGSKESIDRFNQSLLKELRFDESVISKEKLIAYLSAIDKEGSLGFLRELLDSETAEPFLMTLLQEPQIARLLDRHLT